VFVHPETHEKREIPPAVRAGLGRFATAEPAVP
jgi:hypothetical protein